MKSREPTSESVAAKCAVLAASHGGLSEGIRGLLSSLFESVVLVADERSLAACLASLRPELLVLDIGFAPGAGIGLATRLKLTHPDLRIVLLVDDSSPAIAIAATKSGADGCLLRQAIGRDLLAAADEVLAGGKAFWSTNHRDAADRAERGLPDAEREDGTQ